MKLFLVTDRQFWGYDMTLVRADSPEEAKAIACPNMPHPEHVEVEEIPDGGGKGILWSHSESPDSPSENYE